MWKNYSDMIIISKLKFFLSFSMSSNLRLLQDSIIKSGRLRSSGLIRSDWVVNNSLVKNDDVITKVWKKMKDTNPTP